MAADFLTIGHSDRSLEEFLGMLGAAGAGIVIDVRAFPRSRTNPLFNIDSLPGALASRQIDYSHWPAFGGRRPRQTGVDPWINALWRNESFHNYADYALGDAFAAAFKDLVHIGRGRRAALMCAEALWWRCHRRIIADYLLFDGHAVEHLIGPGNSEEGRPTPGAERRVDGTVVYPAPDL